ncbi:hypothetical protein [Pantoea coffeiphila]|uniref:hypothetical protein n=1 Tax=Pantoea coffeiphila TaxID=1465635 RepID=UPI001962279A|nr:hypothetical protein [Pantoea coffeiphila]MBM7344041.1 hypothetical protein [Pantoea coffeiphila]
MKMIIAITPLFLLSIQVSALDVELKGSDTVAIKSGATLKKIKLDTVINGYNVKCDGSKIIIWGKPKKLNEDSPQDTNIILLDMVHNYKKYEQGLSEGIFEVDYLKKGDYAYVGSNQGAFINLFNGHLKEATSEFDPSDENNFESCKKNESWVFKRYP